MGPLNKKRYVEETTIEFWNTKKTIFFHSKTQLICYKNMILKFALILIVGETGFASHTKSTMGATQESTSFMRDNI